MNTTMTTDQITTIVDANKGERVRVLITDGTELIGELISINSKGINVKDEAGTTISRNLNRVQWIEVDGEATDADTDELELDTNEDATDDDDTDADEADANDELNALVAELDGATTAELAEVFGMAAKELRVHLRALGMGVGKGHRYHLTADQITVVRAALTPTA